MPPWLKILERISKWFVVTLPPDPTISFSIKRIEGTMNLTVTGTFSAIETGADVAKQTVEYTINGNTGATLDAANGVVTFTCSTSDKIVGSAYNVSAGGVKSAAFAFDFVAFDNVTAPPSPTISFSIVATPTPAPAPAPSA